LLREAGRLLDLRGTRDGLQLLLDVVTEGRALVRDSADSPAFWVLGSVPVPGRAVSPGAAPPGAVSLRPAVVVAAGAGAARLGQDTVVVARRPGASPAAGGMVAGATRLGPGCAGPERLTAEHASIVTVELRQAPELEPIVDRLVAAFVPAHCRIRVLHTSGATETGLRPRGDLDRRLDDTTRAGSWRLAEPDPPPAVLDHGIHLGARPRPQ
jgi:hypothetical protein